MCRSLTLLQVDLDTLDDSGFSMVLPSGATIGHRSLLRYYKQSLNPVKVPAVPGAQPVMSSPQAVVVARHPHGMGSSGRQLLPLYRGSLGWTGTSGKASIRKVGNVFLCF